MLETDHWQKQSKFKVELFLFKELKMKNNLKIHLVVIDPQNDFCTPNGTLGVPTGALFVAGADADMARLATMIRRLQGKIADIHVTLDSHHLMDVAHPLFWKDSNGNHPGPFTIISTSDLENGRWTPSIPSFYKRMLEYTKALETGKRYPLCIWPPHCLIGTPGQAIVPDLMAAMNEWAEARQAIVDFVTKGSNITTEHYSAVKAEVPDPNDPGTNLNTRFIQTIEDADVVLWAGEAASHCVANTMRDTMENFGPDAMKKMVLLTDATSPVTGFEQQYKDFLAEMLAKGMKTSTTVDYLK
jgi:nicotinamidase-related amidase